MGFLAVGYSGMPRLLLHLLSLLSHLCRISSWLLRLTGAAALDIDYHHYDPADDHDVTGGGGLQEELDAHSPSVLFDALRRIPIVSGEILLPEGCTVCLADFHGAARVRRPRACRHVFHHACLDRWASRGQSTCPLCRAPLRRLAIDCLLDFSRSRVQRV